MDTIQQLEEHVRRLSPSELHAFRDWFAKFDAEMWDQQFEADVHAGRLDRWAERALQSHSKGESTAL